MKRNRKTAIVPRSFISSANIPALTEEGGEGLLREPKSGLFLLSVAYLAEPTFYETAFERDERLGLLCLEIVATDPDWLARFIPYVRNTMQMRAASVALAVEYAASGGPNKAQVVASALQRAEEPAEALAYWLAKYGRPIPIGFRRGLARAATRLYTERSALKYDSERAAVRMGDVIELTHPTPSDERQSALFRYLIDRRHGREHPFTQGLATIEDYRFMQEIPREKRRDFLRERPDFLAKAGMTWEALSSWIPDGMDAEAWESVIPSMGYMALLRNLRNFEQANVSAEVLDRVAAQIADPDRVAHSRQFPIRFFSAYRELPSERFSHALEQALEASLSNVPTLDGSTLVLVDHSGSMDKRFSARGSVKWFEVASLFGAAIAKRSEAADLIAYSNDAVIYSPLSASLLRITNDLPRWEGFGHGTHTFQALSQLYADHDRVVIVTDEQAHPYHTALPKKLQDGKVPVYVWNLAGYGVGHMAARLPNWHTFGGLTDTSFRLIPLLESRRDATWPF